MESERYPVIFEFNFFTWATGYALKRASDWANSRAFTSDLPTNLQSAVATWSKSLPQELYVHPNALFPLKEDDELPPPQDGGPIAVLRGTLDDGHVPSSQMWFDALNEQITIVRTLGDVQAFFKAPDEETAPTLAALAEDLRRVCSHDERLFRSYMSDSVDEVRRKLDVALKHVEEIKAGLILVPQSAFKPVVTVDRPLDLLSIPVGHAPIEPSDIADRIRNIEAGCVACAIVDAVELSLRKQGVTQHLSSRHLYYGSKQLDGKPEQEGTTISAALRFLMENGVGSQEEWPDDVKDTPSPVPRPVVSAQTLVSLDTKDINLFKVLLDRGIPMVMSVALFEDTWFNGYTAHTGVVSMPLPMSVVAGGHAICVVQYDDDADTPGGGYFVFRNSWGTEWAPSGRFGAGIGMVPYKYVSDYAWDVHVVDGISMIEA